LGHRYKSVNIQGGVITRKEIHETGISVSSVLDQVAEERINANENHGATYFPSDPITKDHKTTPTVHVVKDDGRKFRKL
jgi:hypothetical protein